MSLRPLTVRSTGDEINWDKDYPELGRAHQFAASVAEALGIKVLVSTYKGNMFVSNIEEIHAAYAASMK